ncbi:9564_t:CDS:1, partial [Acaulospora morrowiae]
MRSFVYKFVHFDRLQFRAFGINSCTQAVALLIIIPKTIMVRGNSLIDDLKLLINNPRYSDIEISCKDNSVLYGNSAILAARSE